MEYAAIEAAAAARGLTARGGFHVRGEDGVPALSDGRAPASVVLFGNVGSAMWDAFSKAPEAGADSDPLDRWSRRVIGELAGELGAEAMFPFGGPPYLPFLRWAKRAEAVHDSPVGMLIHPDYGLWHAYRGALAFAEPVVLPPPDNRPRPCDDCADKPCLSACPVGAFTPAGYDVGACTGHLETRGGRDCMGGGCLARQACPVGRGYVYEPAHAGFHMRAFLKARRRARAKVAAEGGGP